MFILVAVDYFTKWAKAEALANIRDVDVKKFVWKNIVTRFGVPNFLISDNGLQFDNRSSMSFAVISASRTDTLPRHILKAMGRPKPLTRQL